MKFKNGINYNAFIYNIMPLFIVHYSYDNYNYYHGFNFVCKLPLCVHMGIPMTV